MPCCDFTREHYRNILVSGLASGYSFSDFLSESGTHDTIYLRHDIDVSLHEALGVAEIEADLGIQSTFFVLVNSPLYNLFEDASIEAIQRIREVGHRIGLHVDVPKVLAASSLNEAVDRLFRACAAFLPLERVISFHRPTAQQVNRTVSLYVSAYEPRFFSDIKYLSDSRRVWREGCPCEALQSHKFDRLQLLIHPIWWGTGDDLVRLGTRIMNDRRDVATRYLADNVTPFKAMLEDLDRPGMLFVPS